MFVLGTAGHVDHGKSSLLRALTGMEPDRSPEEKRRGLTMDLGFVWFSTSRWGRIGIVDVPGHRRFVKNMISGVNQIDAFLFVLAADDGWMPQSEEHLAVLKSLGVTRGLGIVTKIDLVTGARAAEVERELGEKLSGAFGRRFETLAFSAPRNEGLAAIREKIEGLVASLPSPRDIGAPRFWIDRVFQPKGLGTVVTGTLREGTLREGDEIELLPGGGRALVKSLQTYGDAVREARPVARVAAQLSRISGGTPVRGMLAVKSTSVPLTRKCDARVDFFESPPRKNVSMALHLGTVRETALVVPFETTPSSFARLLLPRPLPLRAGDRFVLRTAGDERMVGAGIIVDPCPAGYSHKKACLALSGWEPSVEGCLRYQARKAPLLDLACLSSESSFSPEEIEAGWRRAGGFREVGPRVLCELGLWNRAVEHSVKAVSGGTPLGESALSRALAVSLAIPAKAARAFPELLAAAGILKKEPQGYLPAGGGAARDPKEEERRRRLRAALHEGKGQPTSLRALLVSKEMKHSAHALVKAGEAVSLGDDHFAFRRDYEGYAQRVARYLKEKREATTSDLRGYLGTSRKVAVLILEQMDRERVTYLKDNVRRLFREP